MKHIHFMSTNKTVCDSPKTLGYDWVVLNYESDENTCTMCISLLFEYNEKSHQAELSAAIPTTHPDYETLSPMAAFLTGLILGIVMTITALFTWEMLGV